MNLIVTLFITAVGCLFFGNMMYLKSNTGERHIILGIVLLFTLILSIDSFKNSNILVGVGMLTIVVTGVTAWILGRKREEADKEYEKQRLLMQIHEQYDQKEQQELYEKKNENAEIFKKKKEVELKAMQITFKYEKKNNHEPIDVSSQNLGYDIKSTTSDNTRFIEVKGKGSSGDIEITSNEWKKAEEFEKNYYLYVVYYCNHSDPELYIVQNPASKLNAKFNSQTSKYIVTEDEIVSNYSNT